MISAFPLYFWVGYCVRVIAMKIKLNNTVTGEEAYPTDRLLGTNIRFLS
jgi:hypothetical protein